MRRQAICLALALALLMPAGCAPAAESGDVYWLDGYWEEFDPGPDAVSQVVRCDAEGNVEAALSGGHIHGFPIHTVGTERG